MPSLLIVEDNIDFRTALRDVLQGRGFDIMVAANGLEALQILDGFQADAIVLDLEMPVMDGAEFLARRARDARLSRIPVVVLSAWLARQPAPEADARLMKPVSIEDLLSAVDSVMRVHKDRRVRADA